MLIQPTTPDVGSLFVFSEGKLLVNGPFVGTPTNLDTRKTIKVNLSGSHSIVEDSDGTLTITADGTVLSSPFGVISYGRVVLVLDANGRSDLEDGPRDSGGLLRELAGP